MSTIPNITAAYLFAARAHAGQFRKGIGQVPYINHPCAVADFVAKAGGEQAAVIAAVLHDVVEDTSITLDEIEAEFGEEIAKYVAALTDTPEMSALPGKARKAMQAEKIAYAPDAAKLIKLADQTNNLQDLCGVFGDRPLEMRQTYLAGARAIAKNCAGLSDLLDTAFAEAAHTLDVMIEEQEHRP